MESYARVQEVTQEMFQVEKGRHTERHALYWLYLSDARATRVEDFHGVIPADIRRFLDESSGVAARARANRRRHAEGHDGSRLRT